jgi:polyhydroxyalkanoate synthesis repressor PhaR
MSVIIKRYRNRKLYNTQSKRYITLEDIELLINNQEEVKVIDNETGNDITAATLSQIIFDLEKKKAGYLPINLLISLVQSGGKRIDEIRQNIFNSLNLYHHYDVEIERRVKHLIGSGELSPENGTQLLEKLLSVSYKQDDVKDNFELRILELIKERQIPTKHDIHSLISKIDSLSKRVEDITISAVNNEKSDKENQIIE